jgi:hypothetical protein
MQQNNFSSSRTSLEWMGVGRKGVPPSGADDSPVITGLTSSQGKTKLEVLFHLVSHPWLKSEPRESASQDSVRQLQSDGQVGGRGLQLLTVVNNKIILKLEF